MTDLDVTEINEAVAEARESGDWSGVEAALDDLLAQAYGLLPLRGASSDERSNVIARLDRFKARTLAALRGEPEVLQ